MEVDPCKVQRFESPDRVAVNVDLAELDKLCDSIPNTGKVVDDRGFTLQDVMDRRRIGRSQASVIISQLVRDGKVKCIGRRIGRNGPKVYEIVDNPKSA